MNPETHDTTPPARPSRPARNGVDVPTLFATIGAVKAQPVLGSFRFRATNQWINGTHSSTTLETFTGAGADHQHRERFVIDADHPAVLCGDDRGPSPVELLLAALSSCLTAGLVNIASARGVDLEEVRSTIEGDIDVRGILGLSDEVRNGFSGLRVRFSIKADAPQETIQAILEQSRARSAVYDVLTNGIPVTIDLDA